MNVRMLSSTFRQKINGPTTCLQCGKPVEIWVYYCLVHHRFECEADVRADADKRLNW